MSDNVVLPALGESVTEGTVTRWLKKVGDTVAIDEPLVEVSTDKVDTEIPSPVAGTLIAIDVAVDSTVPVGARLAVIGTAGATPATAATVTVVPTKFPEPLAVQEPVPAGPLIVRTAWRRRLARPGRRQKLLTAAIRSAG